MKKAPTKPGDIFKFPITSTKHGYCQWLPHGMARFFLVSTTRELGTDEVIELPEAFCVTVHKSAPGQHGWGKVGVGPYPEQYETPPLFAMQNKTSGKISILSGTKISASTYDAAKRLESAAVWANEHVIERLVATLSGKKSKWFELLKIKPPK